MLYLKRIVEKLWYVFCFAIFILLVIEGGGIDVVSILIPLLLFSGYLLSLYIEELPISGRFLLQLRLLLILVFGNGFMYLFSIYCQIHYGCTTPDFTLSFFLPTSIGMLLVMLISLLLKLEE